MCKATVTECSIEHRVAADRVAADKCCCHLLLPFLVCALLPGYAGVVNGNRVCTSAFAVRRLWMVDCLRSYLLACCWIAVSLFGGHDLVTPADPCVRLCHQRQHLGAGLQIRQEEVSIRVTLH